jgi:nucleotide-binding universal stress UspA family protein
MSDVTTVLCALSFSGSTQATVATAARLCQALGARLVLLHVLAPAEAEPAGGDLYRAAVSSVEQQESARKTLSVLAAGVRARTSLTVDERVESGSVVPTILRVAARLKADFIVVGRSELKRWPYITSLSKTVEQLTRTSQAPIIVCGPTADRAAPLSPTSAVA